MTRRGRWWLATSHHVVADVVPAPPTAVRAFYCDLGNITHLHPLVISVRVTDREQTDESRTTRYRVKDRIPLGPFALTISYTASVCEPTHGDVVTEALQFPEVRLRGRVAFDETVGGTRVTERLTVTAPRPLAALTARQAVKAHAELLAGIRRHFE